MERLDAAALSEALSGVASRVDVVAETGSTNADLVARAAAGEDLRGVVLVAESQTAGRGRNGRSWTSGAGSQLAMSIGVDVDGVPRDSWGWVPLLTGIAVCEAAAAAGAGVGLKWPNDVLATPPAAGKVAGILAEVPSTSPAPSIVVGVGVNVAFPADALPDPNATALNLLGGACTRHDLVIALVEGVTRWCARLREPVSEDLIADYGRHSLTIGARVRATLPGDREVVGDAVGVDEFGRLRIATGADVSVVSAGDIVHLRPV
ncbi:biotin--[acetyl-CoA-carboxylase] ligase [Mycobacterium sp. ST-F2]|uniref:biotin--[acetyl-CoA-carboxylase] ligase n=1 Tax=Mycobacterium sp. ST-F2 TaxID=1490484 RepID=UPI00093AF77F|nr:biotin--[acetyl-CoA-carboxylase] ligase [Mycobacterium sp. ST-F2]